MSLLRAWAGGYFLLGVKYEGEKEARARRGGLFLVADEGISR